MPSATGTLVPNQDAADVAVIMSEGVDGPLCVFDRSPSTDTCRGSGGDADAQCERCVGSTSDQCRTQVRETHVAWGETTSPIIAGTTTAVRLRWP